MYVEEPLKTSTNDQISTQTNKNNTQEAENRYVDVISILQKANSANAFILFQEKKCMQTIY